MLSYLAAAAIGIALLMATEKPLLKHVNVVFPVSKCQHLLGHDIAEAFANSNKGISAASNVARKILSYKALFFTHPFMAE